MTYRIEEIPMTFSHLQGASAFNFVPASLSKVIFAASAVYAVVCPSARHSSRDGIVPIRSHR